MSIRRASLRNLFILRVAKEEHRRSPGKLVDELMRRELDYEALAVRGGDGMG